MFLNNGIGHKIGDVEDCFIVDVVGSDFFVCIFGCCKTGSTPGAGSGMLVVSGG